MSSALCGVLEEIIGRLNTPSKIRRLKIHCGVNKGLRIPSSFALGPEYED